MIPKKPGPDLIRGGSRFSVKMVLKRTMQTVIRLDHDLDSQHDI